jgi:hypothetical protein
MTNSRTPVFVIAIAVIVVGIAYSASHSYEDNRTKSSNSSVSTSDESKLEFDGYDCTADCSGHEAGYKWAEEHDISDGDACDTAGEHSNSPSFAEGCHAYVDRDPEPGSAGDTDKDEDDHDE